MDKMVNVAVFDPCVGEFEYKTILDDLRSYYDLINCSTIDITCLYGMNVVVDDEGLFKPKNTTTYLDVDFHLVGVLVFAGRTDSEGNFTNLSETDLKVLAELKKLVRKHVITSDGPLYCLVVNRFDESRLKRLAGGR